MSGLTMGDLWLPTWTAGHTDPRHPQPPTPAFSAYYQTPQAEQRNRKRVLAPARPASVRITGPLGGSLVTADPAALRAEADRLHAVADTLEAVQEATTTTLFGAA